MKLSRLVDQFRCVDRLIKSLVQGTNVRRLHARKSGFRELYQRQVNAPMQNPVRRQNQFTTGGLCALCFQIDIQSITCFKQNRHSFRIADVATVGNKSLADDDQTFKRIRAWWRGTDLNNIFPDNVYGSKRLDRSLNGTVYVVFTGTALNAELQRFARVALGYDNEERGS